MNLKAKDQRRKRVAIDKLQEERLKWLTDTKGIKAVTVLFTDLEGRLHMLDYDKKFLLKSCGQPDLRRLVDPRLHRAAARPTCGSASTGAPSTGSRRTSSAPARCSSSARSSTRTVRPTLATCAACSRRSRNEQFTKNGNTAQRRQRDRGLPLRGHRRRAQLPRDRQVRVRQHRAATTTRCRAIRCASSSTPPPRCSARWASRTRRITPRWRPRSSR